MASWIPCQVPYWACDLRILYDVTFCRHMASNFRKTCLKLHQIQIRNPQNITLQSLKVILSYTCIYSYLLNSHNICNHLFKRQLLGQPKHYDRNL